MRQGILNPDPHPEFYPSGKMITSDFLKHLAKAFNLKPIGVKSDDDKDDKEDADDWIEPHGLAKGNPAVLKRAVIRQQAATLAVKALKKSKVELEEVDEDKLEKYPDYEAVAPWARKAMAVALDRGIIAPTSDGRLNPEAELSVSEAVALLAGARFPQVTLLSTNDFHGALKRDQKDGKTGKEWGGSSVLAAYADKARAANPAGTVLVDAGDMMQGTAISNVLRGKPVIEVMNRIGYDAAAVGNHEFDWTVKVLEERMDEAGFPFLAANLFEKTTGKRVDWAKPYTILKRRGLKVAIIGVTTPETAFTTLPANVADIEFRDPALVINQLAKELREDGVNLVLVAGHLGGAVDKTGATGQSQSGLRRTGRGGHRERSDHDLHLRGRRDPGQGGPGYRRCLRCPTGAGHEPGDR
ncbi:MAG: S-layer homology domain-containing protein [Actinobacteria bacterium]|nr:S-layer homology domain-containing protein [Actinomycetota bacterium]